MVSMSGHAMMMVKVALRKWPFEGPGRAARKWP